MKNIYKVLVAASGLFAMSACTDLTEHIYSDNTTDNFYNNPKIRKQSQWQSQLQ